MHYIGPCDICGQGLRGIRVCPRGHLAVVCDECEATWTTPDDSRPRFSQQPELPCPTCGAGLWTALAHWADLDEIRVGGWESAVLGDYWPAVPSPSPLDPPDRDQSMSR